MNDFLAFGKKKGNNKKAVAKKQPKKGKQFGKKKGKKDAFESDEEREIKKAPQET